jgi:hypothetical protein
MDDLVTLPMLCTTTTQNSGECKMDDHVKEGFKTNVLQHNFASIGANHS